MDARTVTIVTDIPIPIAFLVDVEVPMKGHIPRNLVKTIFSINMLLINRLIRCMGITSFIEYG